MCCDFHLEQSHCNGSNEGSKHMFSWNEKKLVPNVSSDAHLAKASILRKCHKDEHFATEVVQGPVVQKLRRR